MAKKGKIKTYCSCGNYIRRARVKLGYKTCLACGNAEALEERKSWTVAPLHKSGYQLLPNKEELKNLTKSSK